jgi:hypothetical protein
MCGCSVGVRRRVRAVERNRFGVFFDGLFVVCRRVVVVYKKARIVSARLTRERERERERERSS